MVGIARGSRQSMYPVGQPRKKIKRACEQPPHQFFTVTDIIRFCFFFLFFIKNYTTTVSFEKFDFYRKKNVATQNGWVNFSFEIAVRLHKGSLNQHRSVVIAKTTKKISRFVRQLILIQCTLHVRILLGPNLDISIACPRIPLEFETFVLRSRSTVLIAREKATSH